MFQALELIVLVVFGAYVHLESSSSSSSPSSSSSASSSVVIWLTLLSSLLLPLLSFVPLGNLWQYDRAVVVWAYHVANTSLSNSNKEPSRSLLKTVDPRSYLFGQFIYLPIFVTITAYITKTFSQMTPLSPMQPCKPYVRYICMVTMSIFYCRGAGNPISLDPVLTVCVSRKSTNVWSMSPLQ